MSIALHMELGWRRHPGTPQQNGVAERMNKTLNEHAKSMRLDARLPKTF